MTQPGQTFSPLPLLLLLLSVTTGLVDAISVLGLGKVFTANMTGNIVFLGFAAARTPGFHVATYLVAIAAFLTGALMAGRTGKALAGRSLRRWLMTAALIETGLLWIAALVAIGVDIIDQSPRPPLLTIVGLTALAMGFRNATVRQLKVPDLTTTVLTLTLTGLAADSSLAGGSGPNWPRRIASVVAIFLGATLGALLMVHGGLVPPLLVAGALTFSATGLYALHPSSAAPHAA